MKIIEELYDCKLLSKLENNNYFIEYFDDVK